MKTYLADANVFLRFILKDNKLQATEAKKYFELAKNGKIELIFIPEIISEIEYVLRKVYKESRGKIREYLESLVKPNYIKVESREIVLNSLNLYGRIKIDFVDLILFFTAKRLKAQVLSFDKDFNKLAKSRL